mmetsp:Transcript_8062/g.22265  ORF Transcript_8062/g.22265 Transcript_8062/m.22265 type:complete len:201 (-) Transcript_8062:856-1458(-)
MRSFAKSGVTFTRRSRRSERATRARVSVRRYTGLAPRATIVSSTRDDKTTSASKMFQRQSGPATNSPWSAKTRTTNSPTKTKLNSASNTTSHMVPRSDSPLSKISKDSLTDWSLDSPMKTAFKKMTPQKTNAKCLRFTSDSRKYMCRTRDSAILPCMPAQASLAAFCHCFIVPFLLNNADADVYARWTLADFPGRELNDT